MSDITELIKLEIKTYKNLIEQNNIELSNKETTISSFITGKICGYEMALRSLEYLLKYCEEGE